MGGLALRFWWRIATFVGMRRLIRLVHRGLLSNTLFHFSEEESPDAAIAQHSLRNVFMDVYCDDWAIEDPVFIMKTMLAQVQSGSISRRPHAREGLPGTHV